MNSIDLTFVSTKVDDPIAGMMYFNADYAVVNEQGFQFGKKGDGHLYLYDGSQWIKVVAA